MWCNKRLNEAVTEDKSRLLRGAKGPFAVATLLICLLPILAIGILFSIVSYSYVPLIPFLFVLFVIAVIWGLSKKE
jgi:hypothetical protein